MPNFFRCWLFVLLSGLLAPSGRSAIITNAWIPIFKGVEFTTGEADTNEVRQQKIRALRIDLTEPSVEMFSTPAGGPLETIGQTTTTFVNSYGVAVGVNANFFSPVSTIPNDPRNLSGLAVSQGTLVSPAESGRPMLLVTRSNVVSITTTAPTIPTNFWTAVAGSDLILINGIIQLTNCTTDFCNENPRTAAGLSSDGHYLFLMTIDGRQPGWSDGSTLAEAGAWLLRLGAWRGLNLDGGGSTAMAKLENGNAVLLNRPSGGVQRVNGNHLGVFAPSIAPVLLGQPRNQIVPVGTNLTLTVNAGGTTPLKYQWRFNETNIFGATNVTLSLTNLQVTNSGNYSVLVTNAVGFALSSNALITVRAAVNIGNLAIVPRPNSALISWTSDPQTTSQIEYGVAPNFGTFTSLEISSRTNHQFLLVGLLPNTTYKFRLISQIDGEQIVSNTNLFSTDLTQILDNPNASYSGVWTIATSSADKYGSYYQYATTTSGTATSQATFAPVINTPGKYDVAIWYPQGANRSGQTPILLVYNGGFITTNIDERTGGGAWRTIASGIDCATGNGNYAQIANNTGETNTIVAADAFRWSYSAGQDNPSDGSVPAWWSNFYFGSNVNASLDDDNDGYSTYGEYIIGTEPTDADSHLRVVTQRQMTGMNFLFSPWQGGRIYELQSNTNLLSTVWATETAQLTITNGQGLFSITNPAPLGMKFYRLSVRLAP